MSRRSSNRNSSVPLSPGTRGPLDMAEADGARPVPELLGHRGIATRGAPDAVAVGAPIMFPRVPGDAADRRDDACRHGSRALGIEEIVNRRRSPRSEIGVRSAHKRKKRRSDMEAME